MQPNTCHRIAVLAGGDSDERAISLRSGSAVHAALSERGHQVLTLDPAIVDLEGIDWSPFDVVFIALHGQYGEDGQVQRLLDRAGVPYTGSNAEASQKAFSKSQSKDCFLEKAVPTPGYSLIHFNDDINRVRRVTDGIGYPLIVKPDCQGSSLGVSLVKSAEQLSSALKLAFQYDSFVMAERYITGTEWTVGLLDQMILPPIQIVTSREIFDWQAKYEDDSTRYLFESKLPAEVIQSISSTARAASLSIGAKGLVRVDLRLDESFRPWVLEVNTIPGLTDHSLIPKAAARMGISFGELCEMAIASCLRSSVPAPHILPKPIIRQTLWQK